MEIRIRGVPAGSRAAVMDFVDEYEQDHMPEHKPGIKNGRGCIVGGGKIWVYHTEKAIILTFLPLTKQST